MNPATKKVFEKRTKIINTIREFMKQRDYLEVETPILQDIASGAAATPFKTHHNELKTNLYLRIALELHLKRLIIGGFEKVFEIGRNFRNEGFSKKHNPEFTMLESYEAYADYEDIMKLTEQMIETATKKINGTTKIEYGKHKIDLKNPFKRQTMIEAIKEHLKIDFSKIKTTKEALQKAREFKAEVNESMSLGEIMFEVYDQLVEEKIIQPTFILDYPIEVCPLTKTKRGNPTLTERFELIIAGMEFANAYSELTNPIEQKERFEFQATQKNKGATEIMETDDEFTKAMEYGMPPTGGLGIGRLVMLLTNSKTIKDVIFFPQMKPEKKEK
jgi:lysyl-tRNA synthetase, class II